MQTNRNSPPGIVKKLEPLWRFIALVVLLYLFLICINGMSTAIKGFGKGQVDSVMQMTSNPIVGLMVGMLVTCLLQSSSTTTTMIVTMVGSGNLSVAAAVPMIMGANIGTTITNTLVSLGSMTRSEEFRRSFAAAQIHDVFNLLTVAVLLPLEVIFGVVSKSAEWMTGFLIGRDAEKMSSPIKLHFKSVIKSITHFLEDVFGAGAANWILFGLSVGVLILALFLIVKTMKGAILRRAELFFDRVVGKSALLGMAFGAIITALVQSSSVTTSIMVPLAGAGVVTLRVLFPITLGCNVGTTITALLAAVATGTPEGLTIALCHLLFNLFGITLLYPIPAVRNFTLATVEWVALRCSERKRFAFLYVIAVFYLLPLGVLGLQKLFGG